MASQRFEIPQSVEFEDLPSSDDDEPVAKKKVKVIRFD
jgi:hypothetical protein